MSKCGLCGKELGEGERFGSFGLMPPSVNVCGDCGYSKYELGCLFAQKADAPLSLVEKISEEQGKAFFKDYRAHSAVMDNTRLKRVLGCSSIQVEGIVW